MFLVPMRSPRRVEQFSSYPDEFRRSDFRISKSEVREEKNLKFFNKLLPTLFSFTSPSLSFCFCFVFFLFKVGPTYLFFFSLLGPF